MNKIPGNSFTSPRRPIGRGEPLHADEPAHLAELIRRAAAKFDLSDALNYRSEGRWNHISSSEMVERAEQVALSLISLGIDSGDRVAIFAPNSPNWTLTDAGCQFAGIVDVPIYTTLAPASVAYILNDSGARVLFIGDRSMYDAIGSILAECEALEKIVFFDPRGTEDIPEAVAFERLLHLGAEADNEVRGKLAEMASSIRPGDVATLIYTSGTTGEPKGVMLTHENIVSNVIDCCERYDFTEHDVCLSVLPLSHIFERSAMYLYIHNGMSVYYAEAIEKVPENLSEVKPTILIGVPRIFEKVYAKAKLKAAHSAGLKEKIFDWAIETAKQYALSTETGTAPGMSLKLKHALADKLIYAKLRDFFGGNLRMCITGGAALSDDIYLIFTGAGIPIMQGYGLTETSPVITSNNPFSKRLGTVGKPIRNMQVRIAEDGEIETTGPGVMLGYYNKPDATRDAFTEDGWFRTGDIGALDADGFLKITDRKKELFKTSGGKYIAPSPIEQMIKASRFISQVVLIGSERKFPAALVVPNFEMLRSYAKHKGLKLSTEKEFCTDPKIIDLIERQIAQYTQGLSKYEKVKRIALLEKELSIEGGELTPTLKVKRRIVDEKYKDVIDRIYENAENEKPVSE